MKWHFIWRKTTAHKAYAVARSYIPTGLFVLWILAQLCGKLTWVTPSGANISVGIVQANIEQGEKFDAAFIEQNSGTLR